MLWGKSKKKGRRGKIRKETVIEIELNPKIDFGLKIVVAVLILLILMIVGFKGDEWYNLSKIKDNGYSQPVIFKIGNETQRGSIGDLLTIIPLLNQASPVASDQNVQYYYNTHINTPEERLVIKELTAKAQVMCAKGDYDSETGLCIIDLEELFKEYEIVQ